MTTSTKHSRKQVKLIKPTTPDEYLAPLSNEKRSALQALRKAIKRAAPEAEECISYGVPAFRLDGKLLVAYGAAANHCAFYPGSTLKHFKDELNGYDMSKGTIRFTANKPLPSRLVQKLIKRRISEKRAATRAK